MTGVTMGGVCVWLLGPVSYPSSMKTNQQKAEVYVGFLPFVVMEDGGVEGPLSRGPVSEEDHGGFTGYSVNGSLCSLLPARCRLNKFSGYWA